MPVPDTTLQTPDRPQTLREKSKAQSRARLIEAAAEVVSRHGVHGTTIGEIQKVSGLSRGMINLHFDGKENLLLAVARDLTQRYDAHMGQVIAAAGADPSAQLRAVFEADLHPSVLNARDVAIWFSFRAEMHANPTFLAEISTRSGGFPARLDGICAALLPAEEAPALATNALIAMLEGLWTDYHLNPQGFDRDKAWQTCLYAAARLFPGRFK
ncbi:MAG: TetR family transcriptional regulator C-terminal domain-containing protein [Roseovarius sp.]